MKVDILFPDEVPREPNEIKLSIEGDKLITTKFWLFPNKVITESTYTKVTSELEKMKLELEIAISNENYEDASVIRDLIKEYEDKI